MMPNLDGIQVCKAIRDNHHDKCIKIIFVSAKALSESKQEGYSVGADDYLVKPIDLNELKAKAKVYTRLYNTEKELEHLNDNLQLEVSSRTKELIEKENLAAIGMNSSEMIHNLKNPLMVLSATIQLIKKKGFEQKSLSRLTESHEKLVAIINDFLTDNKRKLNKVKFDLIEIIQKSADDVESHAQ